MSDVNTITLSGRVTRDSTLKTTNGGNSLCEFSIASNRKCGDGEETVYMDVDVWGKRAEALNQYLTQGKYIVVTGRLKQDTWTGQDGSKKSKVVLVAESITMPPLQSQKSEQSKNESFLSDNDFPQTF